jgi:hypothetical protein
MRRLPGRHVRRSGPRQSVGGGALGGDRCKTIGQPTRAAKRRQTKTWNNLRSTLCLRLPHVSAAVITHLVSCEGCLTTARDVCQPYASADLDFAPLSLDEADVIDHEFVAVVAKAAAERHLKSTFAVDL